MKFHLPLHDMEMKGSDPLQLRANFTNNKCFTNLSRGCWLLILCN